MTGLRFEGGIHAARRGIRGGRGAPFTESIAEHARWCARYARGVRPKGTGTIVCYGTSRNGGCGDADAMTVSAIYLDCDGAGGWDLLLRRLRAAGVAYVAYRSGGHAPERPKWRCLVPLAPMLEAQAKVRYQAEYGWIQGLLAEVGGLGPLGFDPATDRLLMPCYPGCRRSPEARVPAVRFGAGRPLDWSRLLYATGYAPPPDPPVSAPAPKRQRRDEDEERIRKRARAWLSKVPGAVSGQGGHRQTYLAALGLVRGFGLDEEIAHDMLIRDYNPRCEPCWSDEELRHKVKSAAKADRIGRGYLRDADRSCA